MHGIIGALNQVLNLPLPRPGKTSHEAGLRDGSAGSSRIADETLVKSGVREARRVLQLSGRQFGLRHGDCDRGRNLPHNRSVPAFDTREEVDTRTSHLGAEAWIVVGSAETATRLL